MIYIDIFLSRARNLSVLAIIKTSGINRVVHHIHYIGYVLRELSLQKYSSIFMKITNIAMPKKQMEQITHDFIMPWQY